MLLVLWVQWLKLFCCFCSDISLQFLWWSQVWFFWTRVRVYWSSRDHCQRAQSNHRWRANRCPAFNPGGIQYYSCRARDCLRRRACKRADQLRRSTGFSCNGQWQRRATGGLQDRQSFSARGDWSSCSHASPEAWPRFLPPRIWKRGVFKIDGTSRPTLPRLSCEMSLQLLKHGFSRRKEWTGSKHC